MIRVTEKAKRISVTWKEKDRSLLLFLSYSPQVLKWCFFYSCEKLRKKLLNINLKFEQIKLWAICKN